MKRLSLLLLFLIACGGHVRAQHDPGRNSVRLIAKGDVDGAIELSGIPPKEGRSSPIDEAEHQFVLAMAACVQSKLDLALHHAKQAVQHGLPIERLHAGPKKVLAPLYSHEGFQKWIEPQRKLLLQGPMIGSLADTSAKFWVRTDKSLPVSIRVKSGSQTVAMVSSETKAANDHTATLSVSGLSPSTKYSYEILVDDKVVGSPAVFRTFPAQGQPSQFSIAFGGGAGFTPQYERMWTTIEKRSVDALLLLGDNVYIDDPKHPMTQEYCYYRRQSQEDWRRLVGSTGVFTIYDDHDFADNDCVPGPAIDEPSWKRDVWRVFRQNWANPSYGGGEKQPGCWYDFYVGDVHFIMLDCRYYRDLKGGTMLGPNQKKWLFDTLQSSKGKFKILTSSVPWSPGVKPGSRDTWDGFPDEREQIFTFLEEHKIDGTVLMSADRHRSDMRRIARPNGYDLYEMMSSRLTNVHTHSLMQDAKGSEFIMGYNEKCSFGYVQFDTTANDPQLNYQIVNIDNEVMDSRTLKFSELQTQEN